MKLSNCDYAAHRPILLLPTASSQECGVGKKKQQQRQKQKGGGREDFFVCAKSLLGSTRQQIVDGINQVSDRGDGDEDEILKCAVLLIESVKIFGVSCTQDFF